RLRCRCILPAASVHVHLIRAFHLAVRRPGSPRLLPCTTLFRSIPLPARAPCSAWSALARGYRFRGSCPPSPTAYILPSGNASLQDRKSTRLNSSHVKSSYAAFCLKNDTTAGRREEFRQGVATSI